MSPPASWSRPSILSLSLISALGLIVGWNVFWFLCDDAYIAFRYVHNFVSGHGLVWNAAPFAPVEGYSSLLWVLLLAAVWSLGGLDPPSASNGLLLAFGFGSLFLLLRMGLTISLSQRLEPSRVPLLAVVVLGTLSNRSFLAWTSSGLEQGMFTFFLLAWLDVALFRAASKWQLLLLAVLAALLELTRPDGLLFAAVTAGMFGLALAHRRTIRLTDLLSAIPLLVPVLHLLWRSSTYGEWLPNTYYAKYVAPWPEAGLRYAASFVFEYAYFLWLPLLVAAVWRWAIAGRETSARALFEPALALRALAIGAVVAHFAYYTFMVGGDVFEYRVYHHLIPLLMLSLMLLVDRAGLGRRLALVYSLAAVAVGLVLPWTHWANTQGLTELHQQGLPHYRIAPHFPESLRGWGAQFDSLQGWLIKRRGIGLRHQTHKLFVERVQWVRFPTRQEGVEMEFGDDTPVMVHRAVGYAGWVLPQVAIIDGLGLNDTVIARTPVQAATRRMAHDRSPPRGYVECFRPNVSVEGGRVRVQDRSSPLSEDEVRSCESRYRSLVDAANARRESR